MISQTFSPFFEQVIPNCLQSMNQGNSQQFCLWLHHASKKGDPCLWMKVKLSKGTLSKQMCIFLVFLENILIKF